MSLGKHFTKYLHPVLKAKGFEYRKPLWMTDPSEPWRVAVELTSSKLPDGRWVFDVDLGLFSYEIDAITDAQARKFEAKRDDLPFGVIVCHFQTSLFSVSKDGDWELRSEPGPFFETEGDAVSAIQHMSERFSDILPNLVSRYATFEAIIDCKYNKIGTQARSKKAGLFAAAACVLLERYDEVPQLLEESIRPGSSVYDKEIGEALSGIIAEKRHGGG